MILVKWLSINDLNNFWQSILDKITQNWWCLIDNQYINWKGEYAYLQIEKLLLIDEHRYNNYQLIIFGKQLLIDNLK